MKRTISPAALTNLYNVVSDKMTGPPSTSFRDVVGGSSQWKGEYTFELIHADTGDVERVVSTNQTVDAGENAVLQFIAGIADNQTITFSGDGSTTQFDIPAPYHPIKTINDVSVGGTSQSVPADYAVDYYEGTLYFDSAPANGTDNISIDEDYYTHPFEWLAVGTDNTAVSDSDASLGSEDTRIYLDSGYYTRSPSSVEITGQWTLGQNQANVVIEEAALFSVPSGAAASGDMLNRTVVSPAIDKSSSYELRVTWTLSM